jgi:hypothetical protein
MSEKSTLTKASPKSESLRATVPKAIVSFLKLCEGDVIEWEMEMKDDDRIAVVIPLKKEK